MDKERASLKNGEGSKFLDKRSIQVGCWYLLICHLLTSPEMLVDISYLEEYIYIDEGVYKRTDNIPL